MYIPSEDSFRFVKEILEEDQKLVERMQDRKGQTEEIYKIYQDRLLLYINAKKMPIDHIHKCLLDSMLGDVKVELIIFQTRLQFEHQIKEIADRIDRMEKEMKCKDRCI
jgi:hypothetical protein